MIYGFDPIIKVNISATGVRILLALAVPFVLLIIGGLGKHLIVAEFRWSNFYLGPDFALAGISAGLLNFLDMLDAQDMKEVFWKIMWTVGYLVITFGIYMLVLCMHQNIEKRQPVRVRTMPRGPDRIGMGFLANFIGLVPSFLFAWLKLKGSL